jgi:hypothetical protein
MDYQQKYLKYKNKYLNLKGILKGGEKMFDFDKFFKSDETGEAYDTDKLIDVLGSSKISEDFLYKIKVDLQIFYKNLYEKLTGTTSETICIPIYFNNTFKVNYYESYRYYHTFYKEQLEEIRDAEYNFFKVIKKKIIALGNRVTRINKIEPILAENIVPFLKNLIISDKDFDYGKFKFFLDFANRYFNNIQEEIESKNNKEIDELFETLVESANKLNDYHILYNISIDNNIGLSIQELIEDLTEDKVNKIMEIKKKTFFDNIIEEFIKSEHNSKVIYIILEYSKNKDQETMIMDNFEMNTHANVIILNKVDYNGKLCIVGQRIEPHRHSSTYCRNSIRKEIRSIFNNFTNNTFYYVDYYMHGHYGLQTNETIDIHTKYLTNIFGEDVKKFNDNINILFNEGGFCASWCAYITSIILLNKNKSIKNISNYLFSFDIDSKDNDTIIDSQIKEFNELKQKYEENKSDYNKNNLKKYYEYVTKFYNRARKGYTKGYDYLFLKNTKLYLFIMYFYKYLNNTIPDIIELYYNIIQENDKDDIAKIIKYIDIDEVTERIEINKKLMINIDEEISKYDEKHFCFDELFTHNELCNTEKICKSVPRDHICFNKTNDVGEICLEGMIGKYKPQSKEELINIKKTIDFLKNINKYMTENNI